MTADFRKLCEELAGWIERSTRHYIRDPDVLIRARAALADHVPDTRKMVQPPADGEVAEPTSQELYDLAAEYDGEPVASMRAALTRWGNYPATGKPGLQDGPAVQSREPASVVEQPSDGNCWQWYTYCPEEGLEIYTDREQAQSAAQSIMGSYEVAAYSDGWHEDMESVSWGILVPVEQAEVVERKTAEYNDEFDEWVKYELRPARYNTAAPQPIPVSERLPEANTKVLAHYFNALGKGRTICAIWVPAKSRSEDCDFPDDDFTEYDEEDDKFYWPEGWYEAIENWDDLGWVKVNEGEIAYWQPLPKWPAQALPLPSGEVEW
jgi:hypothetical protein